ncbi:MAG: cytochrome P450, partial [Actinobacteria bacterium]|nr:cytochrome P450 [Actinomycetota bacterium]
LAWAEAGFNCFGPLDKERTVEGFPVVEGLIKYLHDESLPGRLREDSWGRRLFDAGARGEVAASKCPVMLNAYVTPSLDTTINAISSGIWLFARHPDQWDAVREDPDLIPNAVNEIVRLESPVTAFTRFVKEPRTVDGVELPAGSRAIVIFASANRDERQWEDPDRFDVRREGAARQLGWGYGEHACLGMGLARLEMKAVFGALARHVRRFELRHAERNINMSLRGFRELVVEVEAA